MHKKKSFEKDITILFIAAVFVVVGIVFLKDPKVVSYAVVDQNLEILNKQSYTSMPDSWVVRFKSQGQGDLEVINIGDSFYEVSPFEVKCGSKVFDYKTYDNKIVVKNYECEEVGSISAKILNQGSQTLKIKFGNSVSAYNTAILN